MGYEGSVVRHARDLELALAERTKQLREAAEDAKRAWARVNALEARIAKAQTALAAPLIGDQ